MAKLIPYLCCKDAPAALDFYTKALGAEEQFRMTDDDGKEEAIDVLVQMDIEYLKTVLKQVVPTANIVPVPAANNTVILTGTLAKAEDVNIVLQTARSVVGPARQRTAARAVPSSMRNLWNVRTKGI